MYNLLLVDDEPVIRRGIRSMTALSQLGINEVFEAGEAETALDIIKKNPVDIAFLDINMPGTDGLSFAENVRELDKKIRIVMITGYDYFEYMQRAIRIGIDDYLLKPVNKSDIEQVLKRVISRLSEINIEERLREIAPESVNTADELSQISAYTREHIFDLDFSLGKMAEALGFNSNYLSGLFKKNYGISFQEYVGIKRMEKAKLLLLAGNMKNSEISLSVGYDDVNYFITKFKKLYGVSPKQFKQGVLNNEI